MQTAAAEAENLLLCQDQPVPEPAVPAPAPCERKRLRLKKATRPLLLSALGLAFVAVLALVILCLRRSTLQSRSHKVHTATALLQVTGLALAEAAGSCSVVPSEYCANHQQSKQFGSSGVPACQAECAMDQQCTGGYFFDGESLCYLFGVAGARDKVCDPPKKANPDVTRFDCRHRDTAASNIGGEAPTATAAPVPAAAEDEKEETSWDLCVGSAEVPGLGLVTMVGAKWNKPGSLAGTTRVYGGGVVEAGMKSRSYWADSCQDGQGIEGVQYTNLKLLGRSLRYNVDISGADCGCNAALYLTTMATNSHLGECQDHYCDASNVCGIKCDEIDVQEANKHAWFSTLHTWNDPDGVGGGYGAGRAEWPAAEYGPGARCIDTSIPFTVTASFPTGADGLLTEMVVKLEQPHKPCILVSRTGANYDGLPEMTSMLQAGVTPIMSYWGMDEDMTWMDGTSNGTGPACEDRPRSCGEAVKFWGFAVE